jgi:hypothetical protein
VPTDEVPPTPAVTVERVDCEEVLNGGLEKALELALREVTAPEFAKVPLRRLDVGGK